MEPVAVLEASKRHASGLAWIGGRLVTGGMEGILRVWGPTDGSMQQEVPGHTASVNGIEATAHGAVTVGSDKQVIHWDSDWAEVRRITGFVGAAVQGDDLLLRKDRGDRVYLHGLGDDKARAAVATGLDRLGGVWALPGAWGVSGVDSVLQVRRLDDLSLEGELGGHDTCVTSVSVTSDGTIVTADYGGNVHFWDGTERTGGFATGEKGYFFAAASPDGESIAIGSAGAVSLWSRSGDRIDRHDVGIKGVYGVCWSLDGSRFANAAADGRVRVYEAP